MHVISDEQQKFINDKFQELENLYVTLGYHIGLLRLIIDKCDYTRRIPDYDLALIEEHSSAFAQTVTQFRKGGKPQ